MIVSIDPGVRGCGVAAWQKRSRGGELIKATYVEASGALQIGRQIQYTAWEVEEWVSELDDTLEELIIERPQTYGGRSSKGDTNDLIDVSMVVGALSLLSTCPVDLVRPAEWKGQAKKHVTEARARLKLSDEEISRADLTCGKKLASNVWDAIGIGLWYLQRSLPDSGRK